MARRHNPDADEGGSAGLATCGLRPRFNSGEKLDYTTGELVPSGSCTHIPVMLRPDGRANFSKLFLCGGIWYCPVCAAKLELSRVEEAMSVVRQHRAAGGGLLFMTLTARHGRDDDLKRLRRAVADSWRSIKRERTWPGVRESIEYAGDLRALETTVGPENGWHPHLHGLIFTEKEVTERQRKYFEEWLFQKWAHALEHRGFQRPLRYDRSGRSLGVRVEQVLSDQEALEVTTYVAGVGLVTERKMNVDGTPMRRASAALETTSWFYKKAKPGHRTMWQVLNDLARTGAGSLEADLWGRYITGIKGAQRLTWSRGQFDLRKRYPPDVQLPDSDEEAVYVDDELGVEVAAIPVPIFMHFAWRAGWKPRIQELAEGTGGGYAVMEFIQHCCSTGPPGYFVKNEAGDFVDIREEAKRGTWEPGYDQY